MSLTLNIDPAHSNVAFAIGHLMIAKLSGRFGDVSGTIEMSRDDASLSSVNATIATDSFYTGNADRDRHVKSADFFNVEEFPTMTFTSTSVTADGNSGQVTGDLTIRGVTKSVVLDVTYNGDAKSPYNYMGSGFQATAKIDRRDFGMEWNVPLETGGVFLNNEVEITIDIEAIQS